jgi:hypothetical protein
MLLLKSSLPERQLCGIVTKTFLMVAELVLQNGWEGTL